MAGLFTRAARMTTKAPRRSYDAAFPCAERQTHGIIAYSRSKARGAQRDRCRRIWKTGYGDITGDPPIRHDPRGRSGTLGDALTQICRAYLHGPALSRWTRTYITTGQPLPLSALILRSAKVLQAFLFCSLLSWRLNSLLAASETGSIIVGARLRSTDA